MYNLFMLSSSAPRLDWPFFSASLSPALHFSRASAGTRMAGTQSIETIESNKPRFDYDPATGAFRGLLIEAQRTNYLINSNNLNVWSRAFTPTVVTGIADMMGGTSAIALTNTAINSRAEQSVSLTIGTTYTATLYVKDGGNRYCSLRVDSGTGNTLIMSADLLNATFTTLGTPLTPRVLSLGRGIYQVSFGFVAGAASSTFRFYAVDGTNTIYGNPIIFYMAQLEAGTAATSYISTSGSVATRAADQLSFTIPKGVTKLRYAFDDNSSQDVAVTAGSYVVPTSLNRPWIKRIYNV